MDSASTSQWRPHCYTSVVVVAVVVAVVVSVVVVVIAGVVVAVVICFVFATVAIALYWTAAVRHCRRRSRHCRRRTRHCRRRTRHCRRRNRHCRRRRHLFCCCYCGHRFILDSRRSNCSARAGGGMITITSTAYVVYIMHELMPAV